MATTEPIRFEDHHLNRLPAEVIQKIVSFVEKPKIPRSSPHAVRCHRFVQERFPQYEPRDTYDSVCNLKSLRQALPQLEGFIAPTLFQELRLYEWHPNLKDMQSFYQLCERPVGAHVRSMTLSPCSDANGRTFLWRDRRRRQPEPEPGPMPTMSLEHGVMATVGRLTRFTFVLPRCRVKGPEVRQHIEFFTTYVRLLLVNMPALETLELRGLRLNDVLSESSTRRLGSLKRISLHGVKASYRDWVHILTPCLKQLEEVDFWHCTHPVERVPKRWLLQVLIERGLRPRAMWIATYIGKSWFDCSWQQHQWKLLLGHGSLKLHKWRGQGQAMNWTADGYEPWRWCRVRPGETCTAECCLCYRLTSSHDD